MGPVLGQWCALWRLGAGEIRHYRIRVPRGSGEVVRKCRRNSCIAALLLGEVGCCNRRSLEWSTTTHVEGEVSVEEREKRFQICVSSLSQTGPEQLSATLSLDGWPAGLSRRR